MDKTLIKHIGYIDIAKCIAIVSVVFGHVLAYDLYGFDIVWDKSSLMQFICTFHVPLFMFLSGLLSVTKIKKNDLLKRVRTLIIPFLLIGSIYSLCYYGNLDFIYNEYKYGYWYLFVLFVFYLLTYPICLLGGAKMDYICSVHDSLVYRKLLC